MTFLERVSASLWPYQYSSMKSGKTIRILTILPSGKQDLTADIVSTRVECNIVTESLDENAQYWALSYVWGSPQHRVPIFVDDRVFYVTRNLKEALRRIRHEKETVRLWADAICINQGDAEERGHQISMMAEIYQSASRVIVFLGPAEDGSKEVMEKLESIGTEALGARILSLGQPELAAGFDHASDGSPSPTGIGLESMSSRLGENFPYSDWAKFTKRLYWKRLWIFQEYCLGKAMTIVCGFEQISFDTFAAACLFLDVHINMFVKRLKLNDFSPSPSRAATLTNMMAAYVEADQVAISILNSARRDYQKHQKGEDGFSLMDLLEKCCVVETSMSRREASYPQDLIIGLLGLASDAEKLAIEHICANTKPEAIARHVFTDTSQKLLEHGHLDILAWAQGPNKIQSMPSWVPDFRLIRQPCCGSRNASLFSASGDNGVYTGVFPTGSHDHRYVSVKGFPVDKIKSLGCLWNPDNTVAWINYQKLKQDRANLGLAGLFKRRSSGLSGLATSLFNSLRRRQARRPDDTQTQDTPKQHTSTRNFFADIQEFCRLSQSFYSAPISRNPEKWKEAYWRIPCADQTHSDSAGRRVRACETAIKGYKDLNLGMSLYAELAENETRPHLSVGELDAKLELYKATLNAERNSYSRAMDYLHNRRPFLSEMGFVGLAPAWSKPGDLVAILLRAVQPFVLRDVGENRFELVGEAYVHEIMDGEFLETKPKVEEFVLI